MGVQRRMRMLEYRATFVPAAEADPAQHKYVADPTFIERFKSNNAVRVEFFRYVVSFYDHAFDYSMPEAVRVNSSRYLSVNDSIRQFAEAHIAPAPGSFFTLKEARQLFLSSEYATNDKRSVFCQELQRLLGVICCEQYWPPGAQARVRSAFLNHKLVYDEDQLSEA
jgi:hypothetical protein